MPPMKKGLPSFMKRVPLTVRPPGSDGAAGNDGPAEVVAHALNTRPPAATAAPCRISRRLGSRMRLCRTRYRVVQALARAASSRHLAPSEPGAVYEKIGLDCVAKRNGGRLSRLDGVDLEHQRSGRQRAGGGHRAGRDLHANLD